MGNCVHYCYLNCKPKLKTNVKIQNILGRGAPNLMFTHIKIGKSSHKTSQNKKKSKIDYKICIGIINKQTKLNLRINLRVG